MNNYESKRIPFEELHLDTQNPRFIGEKDEDEILDYLIKYENITELVDGILRNGFLTLGERLICLYESPNKYIVLEGNRRLAACILINNKEPGKIPYLDCDVVFSREDANLALESRHINGIKKWPSITKKYFYAKKFESGFTIDQIKDFSTETKATIEKMIAGFKFIKCFYTLNFRELPEDQNLLEKLDTDIIDSRIFLRLKESLQFSINKNTYEIEHKNEAQKNEFDTILKKIGKALWIDHSIDTRRINTVEDWSRVISENTAIPDLVKNIDNYKSQEYQFDDTSETISNENSQVVQHSNVVFEKTRIPKKSKKSFYIIRKEFAIAIKKHSLIESKILDIIDELKYLDVWTMRYSAFITFRTLLQLSIKQFVYFSHPEVPFTIQNNNLHGLCSGIIDTLKTMGLLSNELHSSYAKIFKKNELITMLNSEVHDIININDRIKLADACASLVGLIQLLLSK